MVEQRTVVVTAALAGLILVLVGLGLIGQPPGGGGGGTTTTTSITFQDATLNIKAVNEAGHILSATISVDSEVKGSGQVSVTVSSMRKHVVTFGDVQGYYTPSPVEVTPIPGETVEIVGKYMPKVAVSYLLTVNVQQCNPFDNQCSPLAGADVMVDDGQRGRTGQDGSIVFRVLRGVHKVNASISGLFIGEQTVDVQADTSVAITYWVWFSVTGFPAVDATVILVFAVLAAFFILMMRRRR